MERTKGIPRFEFLNRFRIVEDVQESETIGNVIDPIYAKVFHQISPNMILDMIKV